MKKQLFFAALCAAIFAACGGPVNLTEKPLAEWHAQLKDTGDPALVFFQSDSGIRMSGDYGYIRTTETYADYELAVEWRWIDEPSNSGIFLHVYEDGIWPSGYEVQLQAGNAGDIINSGAGTSREHARNLADSVAKPHVIRKMHQSNEAPVGEWNQALIRSKGNSIRVWINGQEQNEVTGISSTSGFVGLQSEGKGIEFRNVILTPLK